MGRIVSCCSCFQCLLVQVLLVPCQELYCLVIQYTHMNSRLQLNHINFCFYKSQNPGILVPQTLYNKEEPRQLAPSDPITHGLKPSIKTDEELKINCALFFCFLFFWECVSVLRLSNLKSEKEFCSFATFLFLSLSFLYETLVGDDRPGGSQPHFHLEEGGEGIIGHGRRGTMQGLWF